MPLLRTSAEVRAIAQQATKLAKQKPQQQLAGGRTVSNLGALITQIKMTTQNKLSQYIGQYDLLRTEEDVTAYFDKLIEDGIAALDTETSGLDTMRSDLAGLCLYSPNQKPCYIPVNHVGHITKSKLKNQVSESFLKTQIDRCNDVKWIMHNANFDIRVVEHTIGSRIHVYWDTLLAAKLLNENEPAGLKEQHLKYCASRDTEALTISKLFDGLSFPLIPIECAYLYAAGDSLKTFELYEFQKKHLRPDNSKLAEVYNIFRNIEIPLVDVLVDMEDTGVMIDQEYAKTLHDKYHGLLEEAKTACYECLDRYKRELNVYRQLDEKQRLSDPVNLSSPTQIAIVLYDVLKLKPKGNKDYKRATGEEVLNLIEHDFPKLLLNYRGIEKLITTYVDKLPLEVNPKTKSIHASFNSSGTVTGRLSSSNPNLQNIPSHNKDIRPMFMARPGNYLVGADFSGQEPRLLAHMSGDPELLRAFKEGKDVYAWIGTIALKVPYEDCLEFYLDENGNKTSTVNKEGKRRRGEMKVVLLGLMYGRGASSIAEQLGISKADAQVVIDTFYKSFPAVKKFLDESTQMAQDYGFVTNAYGRKRRLPEMMLPEFEFKVKDATRFASFDPLDFSENATLATVVPEDKQDYYWAKMSKAYGFKQKMAVKEEAANDGIEITDNGGKIADATRQCVNSRIQGSAADVTKTAMIAVHNDQKLKDLGFKLVLTIHDELIGECPIETVWEASERFCEVMIGSCADKISVPMLVDAEVTERWYGDTIEKPEEGVA